MSETEETGQEPEQAFEGNIVKMLFALSDYISG